MEKIALKYDLHQGFWRFIYWGGGMAGFVWLPPTKMGLWITLAVIIAAFGIYHMMIGRWRAIEASSFIYDKSGMLMYTERSCYIPYGWFKKNNASVEYFPPPEMFRVTARCFAVDLGEIILSVEGVLNMAEKPHVVFREVFRKNVNVRILTENLLKEVLLVVDLPASAEEVRDKAKYYLQKKLPDGVVTFNCFCTIKHGDKFII